MNELAVRCRPARQGAAVTFGAIEVSSTRPFMLTDQNIEAELGYA